MQRRDGHYHSIPKGIAFSLIQLLLPIVSLRRNSLLSELNINERETLKDNTTPTTTQQHDTLKTHETKQPKQIASVGKLTTVGFLPQDTKLRPKILTPLPPIDLLLSPPFCFDAKSSAKKYHVYLLKKKLLFSGCSIEMENWHTRNTLHKRRVSQWFMALKCSTSNMVCSVELINLCSDDAVLPSTTYEEYLSSKEIYPLLLGLGQIDGIYCMYCLFQMLCEDRIFFVFWNFWNIWIKRRLFLRKEEDICFYFKLFF